MILQDSRNWFSEEGQLTKTICEQTSKDIRYDENDCCACDEAKYSVSIFAVPHFKRVQTI